MNTENKDNQKGKAFKESVKKELDEAKKKSSIITGRDLWNDLIRIFLILFTIFGGIVFIKSIYAKAEETKIQEEAEESKKPGEASRDDVLGEKKLKEYDGGFFSGSGRNKEESNVEEEESGSQLTQNTGEDSATNSQETETLR